MNGEKSMNI
jgi:hypothetical protein